MSPSRRASHQPSLAASRTAHSRSGSSSPTCFATPQTPPAVPPSASFQALTKARRGVRFQPLQPPRRPLQRPPVRRVVGLPVGLRNTPLQLRPALLGDMRLHIPPLVDLAPLGHCVLALHTRHCRVKRIRAVEHEQRRLPISRPRPTNFSRAPYTPRHSPLPPDVAPAPTWCRVHSFPGSRPSSPRRTRLRRS